ncbi:Adenylate kinase 7, partial [Dufourea novaeangliae]
KKYEVIGTTSDPEYPRPEDVTMIIKDARDRDALLAELMNCGIVIYDITEDRSQAEEARWALKAIIRELERMEQKAPKAFKRNEDQRHFVLISTLMTWAFTKPLSPDEPELAFTEDDYRKRKPHPNFKEHIQCEKDVVVVKKKLNLKNKLKTVVICSGITYGEEEGPLHHLFKRAWMNEPFLPIFGNGTNKIPLLHVRDLVTVVIDVLQNWPSLRYIVATEEGLSSQTTIVKRISRALGTGKVKKIVKEEAFLLSEVTQQAYDLMTVNLNVQPEYITDRIAWRHDTPFRDNINAIAKEYRIARSLHPLKIIVLGPPVSGKTRVARYLADYYGIHYVHVKSLIEETVQKLTAEIEEATSPAKRDDPEETGAGDDVDEEEDEEELDGEERAESVEELRELLDEIEQNMQRNKGRLDDSILNKLFLRKLRSMECRNQGYVMDGYPKTLEQAKILFGGDNSKEVEDEEGDIDEEATDTDDANYSIMPELVVSLEATDGFLIERIIQRPEWEIQGTHYTEEHMMRRLKEYRKRNTDENTPLQFFDEIEIHPLIIGIEDDVCPDMFPTIYQCLERLGSPKAYGLTAERAMKEQQRAQAEAHATEAAAKLQEEKEILERKREREEKMQEWTNLMEKLKEEEEERLCLMGMPLRHYLVKYIFPTLTQGLIEVANLRPDDPIDFLAEYLFKENPEGKMFQPDYTKTMKSVLDAIEKFQGELLPAEEFDDKVKEFLKQQADVSDAEETSASSVEDVCTHFGGSDTKMKPCVTPCFRYDDVISMEKEGESLYDGDMDFDGDDVC